MFANPNPTSQGYVEIKYKHLQYAQNLIMAYLRQNVFLTCALAVFKVRNIQF